MAEHITSDDNRSYVYQEFSRGEAAWGLFWLSLGGVISVLLEIVYLNTWVGPVPVPYTVAIAFLFNMVLTRTAMLWTKKSAIALIPMYAWALGFFGLMVAGGVTGDQLLGASLRPLLLMIAGFVGGGWPLLRGK
ncbi:MULTISPECIES: hypothetical protein [Corynebacterium]|uniref:Uncharacterized protein n=1 Tax=Corynebacterium ramonii TaxID=3026968 RepID=A0ABN4EFN5_9CORY|nr:MULTISPECIES: hypothetical protein [Corynebacterium]AIU32409.1 Hypothetical protein CulFRC11_0823 [Corynebacterium ramonii FRC0011]AKA96376.1 Membrane protein [Corynebacterium ulcerans]ESU58450.1 membrane protein [Corynebacterium ulcerans NCTC 12077]OAG70843.1 hypothetical protein AFK49_005850 [Corynebacterium ulcerans]STC76669.1 hypothetical membrane protein [Corynebacterium ulcerans]